MGACRLLTAETRAPQDGGGQGDELGEDLKARTIETELRMIAR